MWVPYENRPHVIAEAARDRQRERYAEQNAAYLAERSSFGLDARPVVPVPAAPAPAALAASRPSPSKVPRIAPVGPVSSVTGLPIHWTAAQVAAYRSSRPARSKGTP